MRVKAITAVVLFITCIAFCTNLFAAGPDPAKVADILKAGGGAVGGIGFLVLTGMGKVVPAFVAGKIIQHLAAANDEFKIRRGRHQGVFQPA